MPVGAPSDEHREFIPPVNVRVWIPVPKPTVRGALPLVATPSPVPTDFLQWRSGRLDHQISDLQDALPESMCHVPHRPCRPPVYPALRAARTFAYPATRWGRHPAGIRIEAWRFFEDSIAPLPPTWRVLRYKA